jgi:hypothetical protein
MAYTALWLGATVEARVHCRILALLPPAQSLKSDAQTVGNKKILISNPDCKSTLQPENGSEEPHVFLESEFELPDEAVMLLIVFGVQSASVKAKKFLQQNGLHKSGFQKLHRLPSRAAP